MSQPQSVFTNQEPNNKNANDSGTKYELGMKFQSTKPGKINAIRYWKATNETGTHTGTIWSATGTVLAKVTFSNETASGWQQQTLTTPLSIQANTTYVVSVNTNGFFAVTNNGLGTSITNLDLKTVADGNNGVFGNPGVFPKDSFQNNNYFRDVVFVANAVATITKVGGDNQSGKTGTVLLQALTVQVKNSAGQPQAGVKVNFAITSGSGSVSPVSAVTNANGHASTKLTLGTSVGKITVKATASGIGSTNFTATATLATTNAIYLENQKTGTTAWQIPFEKMAGNEVAGYASATSVNKGGSLDIKVSLLQDGQFSIDVYRLGYYAGTGARLMVSSGFLNGFKQPKCEITDPSTRLVECKWATSYTLQVGADWTSGLYIAKLTDKTSGKQSQVWFVVRHDNAKSDVLFQSSFTNHQAYNKYGGYSLYDFNSNNFTKAWKVSFDRPFSQALDDIQFNNILRWEFNMIRWLESQSYDVLYVTNLDIHSNPLLLRQHKVFLSVGHDEYWSMEERLNVEQARDANPPTNLAFFSANTAYWRVRFEESSDGQPNRVMVCYKEKWDKDPIAPTNKFRSPQNNQPENALLGVMYTGDRNIVYGGYDFVVKKSDDPYYANTGLKNGDKLERLVGFEWDGIVNNGFTPPGLVILAESPVDFDGQDLDVMGQTTYEIAHAVRYTASSGGKVFSTGSIQWMWGLDSFGVKDPREDPRAKQIAVNVLADMGAKPLTPSPGVVVPT
ncbi:MAG: DUF4082 domain-containing protein [Desmonostoc vinosum HA7617-LM4]|jgi:hypothetical protein|nr:DUF4082 domain-containing protein [Desmonostoc vinosum HA7617-LM4]